MPAEHDEESAVELPSVSIVIEWENIALSAEWRTELMLGRLNHQLHELAPSFRSSPEVLILYESDEVNREQINRLTDRMLSNAGESYELEFSESDDLDYYKAKNHGAHQASGEIVVFLDSDVIPEDDWLYELVSPFADEETMISAGHTYMEPHGLAGSVFALFWFFPTRENKPISEFFANNVAFRRSLFLDYQFPDLPMFRGQYTELNRALEKDGIEITHSPNALTRHPPPNDLAHFVTRALAQGYDYDRHFRRRSKPSLGTRVRRSIGQLRENVRKVVNRAITRADDIDHGWALLAPGLIVGMIYYLFVFLGQIVSSLHPGIVRSRIEL